MNETTQASRTLADSDRLVLAAYALDRRSKAAAPSLSPVQRLSRAAARHLHRSGTAHPHGAAAGAGHPPDPTRVPRLAVLPRTARWLPRPITRRPEVPKDGAHCHRPAADARGGSATYPRGDVRRLRSDEPRRAAPPRIRSSQPLPDAILPAKVRLDRMYAERPRLRCDIATMAWTAVAMLTKVQVAVYRESGRMRRRRRDAGRPPLSYSRADSLVSG